MSRRLRDLGRDESGNSVIELALIAPILGALVIGIIDLSHGFSERLALEQVAQRTVEKAMQGMQGDDTIAIFDSLRAEAAATAKVPLANVTVRYWLECNGVSQNTSPATMAADYGKVCESGQRYSRHLNVRIIKTHTPMFKLNWGGRNANGTFTLRGEAGLRVQ